MCDAIMVYHHRIGVGFCSIRLKDDVTKELLFSAASKEKA